MKIWIPIISFLLILQIFTDTTFCQDSLYLVGTITGESVAKKITEVKGIGDVNGDGYDDFMVTTDNDEVMLYLGSSLFNLIPSITFHYPGSDTLAYISGATGIGDINGDGFDDFIIRGYFYDYGYPKGKIFLYNGGLTIDTITKYEFYEPWIQDGFGHFIHSAGDINKDGNNDFFVGSSYNWSNGLGRVYLFFGGDTVSFDRSVTFISDVTEDEFGTSVANIGDISGDGNDDIAIGAPASFKLNDSGKVYIYYGGDQIDTRPDTVVTSIYIDHDFGKVINNVGDINNNGIIDFCIGNGDKIIIYFGYHNIYEPIAIKGYSIGAGGDINNDGYDDLIIGRDRSIHVYYGTANFDAADNLTIRIQGSDSLTGFSSNISIAGDINGDGFDDVIALAPNWPNSDNPQGKVYLYSYNKIDGISDPYTRPSDNFELFQNYPNPFNPTTSIGYQVLKEGFVTIRICDVLGRELAMIVNQDKKPGKYIVEFNAAILSSGMYYYQLRVNEFVSTKKMMLLK